ncbi:photoreceptor ankyrin repeat protein [Danio rerio]|uniref:Ankyrin repeat domain 33Ab n=2 Tax=Danio rerio TaxID=7955 RepID=E7F2T9_DANRE|nr:ankyrin repeat domain-containing protein 33B [Danio rerio]|eukprot:XP_021332886.1 ankyrin repeat domain-containing protein 33B [Danio rerio]
MAAVQSSGFEDPHLGSCPDGDEISLLDEDTDSGSLLSEDSVLPEYELEDGKKGTANTLYEACVQNDPEALKRILERGVTCDEVMEVDINGWNGLMVAAYKGFLQIVYELHGCPHLNINHQDNDGNTALMIAAQAGHVSICNYIMNYFPGADTEIRDNRGFTALIKAAIQGRNDVVAALIMHGADVNAVDSNRGKCARDWALKTGRFDTLKRLRHLALHPTAEQFCDTYVPEWPNLKVLVSKATANRSAGQKLTHHLKNRFGFSFPRDPVENGVMDHMVRMTTSLHSPLIATATRPLCPSSPPQMGKRRLAVAELMQKHSEKLLEESSLCHRNSSISSVSPSFHSAEFVSMTCCPDTERRGSVLSIGMRTFIPRSVASRRNSIFPSGCIPQIKVTKSSEPTPKKEKKNKKDKGYLEPPKWKYKEAKEEKKKEKKALKEKEKEEKDKEKKSKDKEKRKKNKYTD